MTYQLQLSVYALETLLHHAQRDLQDEYLAIVSDCPPGKQVADRKAHMK